MEGVTMRIKLAKTIYKETELKHFKKAGFYFNGKLRTKAGLYKEKEMD